SSIRPLNFSDGNGSDAAGTGVGVVDGVFRSHPRKFSASSRINATIRRGTILLLEAEYSAKYHTPQESIGPILCRRELSRIAELARIVRIKAVPPDRAYRRSVLGPRLPASPCLRQRGLAA